MKKEKNYFTSFWVTLLGLIVGGLALHSHLTTLNHTIITLTQNNTALEQETTRTIAQLQEEKTLLERLLREKLGSAVCIEQSVHSKASPKATNPTTAIQTKAYPSPHPRQAYQREASQSHALDAQLAAIAAMNPPTPKPLPHTNYAQELIYTIAQKELGKPYVWGAVGPSSFDCSGFTSKVFKKIGVWIPRTSNQQSCYGRPVKQEELKRGDLLFFATSRAKKETVNHVGIYIGERQFIHASSAGKSVVITSLDEPFYARCYKGARRVVN